MRRFFPILAALVCGVLANPAGAYVTYTFVGGRAIDGQSFIKTTADYLTGDASFRPSELDSCGAVFGDCRGVNLYELGSSVIIVFFEYDPEDEEVFDATYRFSGAQLDATGTWFSPGFPGGLFSISGAPGPLPEPPPIDPPGPPVPEPGTWALMLLGFGLAGTALRRRQRVRPA